MSEQPNLYGVYLRLSMVSQSYLYWSETEKGFSAETIRHRQSCFRQIGRIVGDKPITQFTRDDLLFLKRTLMRRNLSPSRQAGILYALKDLLLYCQEVEPLVLQCLPEDITFP